MSDEECIQDLTTLCGMAKAAIGSIQRGELRDMTEEETEHFGPDTFIIGNFAIRKI